MNRRVEPSCGSCPKQSSCWVAGEPGAGADAISPARLVGQSVVCFLLPPVAGIVAAALAGGQTAGALAGLAGFASACVVVALAGRLVRALAGRKRMSRAGRGAGKEV